MLHAEGQAAIMEVMGDKEVVDIVHINMEGIEVHNIEDMALLRIPVTRPIPGSRMEAIRVMLHTLVMHRSSHIIEEKEAQGCFDKGDN